MTLLIPCCSFLRVFDTSPLDEVLTLPELTAALRRFEVKPQTAARVERDIARIGQAQERLLAGETPRGKFMGKLFKVMEKARRSGGDPGEALKLSAQQLISEAQKSAKRDLRLWSPALYRPGAVKRGSASVTHVSCLVCDFDDGTTIEEASTTWSAFFHLVYTTWSHQRDHARFRLVVPLAFPVPSEEWSKVWSWAEEHAHFTIDPAMKSPAATYALPVVRHRDWPREAFSRPGAIFDPVAEGILERPSSVVFEPKHPPDGVVSAIRGEDPDKEYIDHADPDAVYFVENPWDDEQGWAADPDVVAAVKSNANVLASSVAPTPAVASTAGALVTDSLERLARLHASGALTPDEFVQAKALVLAPDPDEGRRARPLLCVDFDGVLHSYASGWKGPTTISDPPVDGAIEWLAMIDAYFDLAVTSVRNASPGAADAMRAWFREHGLDEGVLSRLAFPRHTPRGDVYLDDRGYRFEGRFPSFDELGDLEPWHARKKR